jgi:fructose 1,6-bisphosphate aldolase/phosphatase
MKIMVSVIKADVGSIGGHIKPSQKLKETMSNYIHENEVKTEDIIDVRVSGITDDIAIVITNEKGPLIEDVHKLAWDAFVEGTRVAKEQGRYGAGQDLLKDALDGRILKSIIKFIPLIVSLFLLLMKLVEH